MKKRILALFLVCMLLAAMPVYAEQIDVYDNQNQIVKSVVFGIGVDEYYVNGQTPGTKMDAKAFIENDRTYVPVRYLAYALGLTENEVKWEQSTRKVTLIGPATLELVIDVPQITTNGAKKTIDVAPVIRDSRTYLPARYVAEGLGFEVAWDAATKTVICWPKGTERPDVSQVQQYVVQQRGTVYPGDYPSQQRPGVIPGHVDGVVVPGSISDGGDLP